MYVAEAMVFLKAENFIIIFHNKVVVIIVLNIFKRIELDLWSKKKLSYRVALSLMQ